MDRRAPGGRGDRVTPVEQRKGRQLGQSDPNDEPGVAQGGQEEGQGGKGRGQGRGGQQEKQLGGHGDTGGGRVVPEGQRGRLQGTGIPPEAWSH